MKLRISRKDICDVIFDPKPGEPHVEFLVTEKWVRIPAGKAELVDEKGKARPVKLTARRVGFHETWVRAEFLDREMGAGG
jgi:hypothetical protein